MADWDPPSCLRFRDATDARRTSDVKRYSIVALARVTPSNATTVCLASSRSRVRPARRSVES